MRTTRPLRRGRQRGARPRRSRRWRAGASSLEALRSSCEGCDGGGVVHVRNQATGKGGHEARLRSEAEASEGRGGQDTPVQGREETRQARAKMLHSSSSMLHSMNTGSVRETRFDRYYQSTQDGEDIFSHCIGCARHFLTLYRTGRHPYEPIVNNQI